MLAVALAAIGATRDTAASIEPLSCSSKLA
jgi:hypothetical protein